MAEEVKSTCKGCHGGCRVIVTVEGDRVLKVRGDRDSLTLGTMCSKGLASPYEHHNPNRILRPLKRVGPRGSGKWTEVSWEEALDLVAEKIRKALDRHGPHSVLVAQGTGRGYNRYTLRFARSIGAPNVLFPAHFCFAPKMAAFGITVGGRLFCDFHGWAGVYPRTIVQWGKQLEYTNADGEMGVWFLRALERAENLILIDPRATALAHRAKLWLPVRPGTDAALALGMINHIIQEGLYDREFVERWTYGFDRLAERAKEYDLRRVSEITWVQEGKIREAAELIATCGPSSIQMGEALEASNNSIQTLRAIICLMALTGNIERPGGMVSWLPSPAGPMEDFALEVPAPKESPLGADEYKLLGMPPFAMCHWETVCHDLLYGEQRVKVMHLVGTNPVLAYADAREVFEAFNRVEFISVVDLYMGPSARFADLVLPAAHWLEMDDIYDMHPRFFVSAIVKAVDPPGEAKPDNWIFLELGRRLAPQYWPFEDVEAMLDYQLRHSGLRWREFKEVGVLATTGPCHYEKHKTDHWRKGGGFPTPTGKVELYSTVLEGLGFDPLPHYREPNESPLNFELAREYPLIVTTGGRLPYYFHSQYRQNPLLRELQPYPEVQIHPETARRHGIKEGDWVWIETPRGRIKQKARLFAGMDPRIVVVQASWYYPEDPSQESLFVSNANVLTSNDPPYDPCIGSTTFRALMGRIYRAEEGDEALSP